MMHFNVFEKVAQLTEARRMWLDEKSEEMCESGNGNTKKAFCDYERNLEKMGMQFQHDCPYDYAMINMKYREMCGDIATTREYAALYLALSELSLISEDDDN